MALKWSDADEIGYQLHESFPTLDPLKVRFTDLRQRVLDLKEFADDPELSAEGTLEAIQMAWLGYYKDAQT